jgi:hypothetical protein
LLAYGEDGRVTTADIRVQGGAFRDARLPYGDVPWRGVQLELDRRQRCGSSTKNKAGIGN